MPIVNSYEDLRDSCDDKDVRVEWRDGDRWSSFLRESYEKIDENPDLSDEGRQRQKEEIYERHKDRAAKSYEAARQRAKKLSDGAYDNSIPFPEGRTLSISRIKDAAELSTVQAEAAWVYEMVNTGGLADKIAARTGKRPKNIQQSSDSTLDGLRAAYAEGLELGGIEGKTRCHAVLGAAKRIGYEVDAVVEPFREDKHRDSYERALRYDTYARTIPGEKQVPKPPEVKTSRRGVAGTYRPIRNQNPFLAQEKRLVQGGRRGSHWK